jgi:hypothetical protein
MVAMALLLVFDVHESEQHEQQKDEDAVSTGDSRVSSHEHSRRQHGPCQDDPPSTCKLAFTSCYLGLTSVAVFTDCPLGIHPMPMFYESLRPCK